MSPVLGRRVRIAGTGASLPSKVLTNRDLEAMIDTSDDWILERTGIRERRIASPGETTSLFATRAAEAALERAGVLPKDIDTIIVATITPDHVFPSTACHVQQGLGASRASAFDLSAACTGFLYALDVGWRMVASGGYRHVLVIGAECLSAITDYQDRATCILFGDGAGAVVLSPAGPEEPGEILWTRLAAAGNDEVMVVPGGGSAVPASHDSVERRLHFMRIDGKRVFKFAVSTYRDLVAQALAENGLTTADLKLLIPHQVNLRIIEAAQKKLDVPPEKVYVNIDRYGNTSAASVPIALAEADREGRLEAGDVFMMVGFGAGLTWGAAMIRW